MCISHQKQQTEMHINTVMLLLCCPWQPLAAKVFSSQLQQTSIWSCERNSPFVTTELVVEQRCTEKTLVLLGFRGFAQKTNHTEYHPQRAELTAN